MAGPGSALLLLISSCIAAASSAILPPASTANMIYTEESLIKQVMSQECQGPYTAYCLKLGLLRLVSKAGSGEMSILPGVSITWQRPQLQVERSSLEDADRLDSLLLSQLGETLSNISLSVRVLDKETPLSFANAALGEETSLPTGRKKDKYGGALAAAGLMSGGTMLALGMSALAAMAGKALMASLLALMLAGISALRGNGDGDGHSKTTYEIVAKPVVSHHNTHSSEVVHGGHHYKRSIAAQDLAYTMQIPK